MKQKRTVLVFDQSIIGHHLEYIHHLYEMALSDENKFYVFAIPSSFKTLRSNLLWKECQHISFYYLEDEYLAEIDRKRRLQASFQRCILLRKVIKEVCANDVFLISLMSFLPFLPFLISNKIKLSGIIYRIYLYEWNSLSFKKKVLDVFKYTLLSRFTVFNTIYILNDSSAVAWLNRSNSVPKFRYLPDPYLSLKVESLQYSKEDLGIETNKKVILHFGALSERKGSLNILKAIELMDEDTLRKYCFVFAGIVDNDIKTSFYQLYNIVKEKTQIVVFDKFCEYQFLGQLCLVSDIMLVPYTMSAQSSGVIAYAAQFNKLVIGPESGLLGKMIRKYKLGLTLSRLDGKGIARVLSNTEIFKISGEKYLSKHTISEFQKTIFNNI